MSTEPRVRWEPLSSGPELGYVTFGQWLFQVYKPTDDADSTEQALMSYLPGQTGEYWYGEDRGKLKDKAEEVLTAFVDSLGAVFPPEPDDDFSDDEDGEPLEVRYAAGRLVRYAHPGAGYPGEAEHAAASLVIGEVYTIGWADIGQSRTNLNLYRDGTSVGSFNSVFFDLVAPETPATTGGE